MKSMKSSSGQIMGVTFNSKESELILPIAAKLMSIHVGQSNLFKATAEEFLELHAILGNSSTADFERAGIPKPSIAMSYTIYLAVDKMVNTCKDAKFA